MEANVFGEFPDSVRVNTLRKMLDQQFGAKVWDVMDMLLRAAPPSPGAPTPNEDQSHCSSEYRTVRAPCWPGAGSSIERSVTSNNCWKELATGAASVFPAIPRYWLPASRSTDCCCTPRSVLKPRVPSLAIIPRSAMCGRYRRKPIHMLRVVPETPISSAIRGVL